MSKMGGECILGLGPSWERRGSEAHGNCPLEACSRPHPPLALQTFLQSLSNLGSPAS